MSFSGLVHITVNEVDQMLSVFDKKVTKRVHRYVELLV